MKIKLLFLIIFYGLYYIYFRSIYYNFFTITNFIASLVIL